MNGDLVVLAADKDIEHALRGLLTRPRALGIRPLWRTEIVTHPQHDPGLFKNGPELVRRYATTFDHALLVLDGAWEGAPEGRPMEGDLNQRLAPVWRDRARALCIQPEVEVWVWSDSPQVAKQLGWEGMDLLRSWLVERGLWAADAPKPADPKAAFRAALQARTISASSAIFKNLGESVGVGRCQDEAFTKLLGFLRHWFPAESP